MHAVAAKRVEVRGQHRHQRLALAGAHLGNLALVQDHAADELHVEGAQAQHAARRLAHDLQVRGGGSWGRGGEGPHSLTHPLACMRAWAPPRLRCAVMRRRVRGHAGGRWTVSSCPVTLFGCPDAMASACCHQEQAPTGACVGGVEAIKREGASLPEPQGEIPSQGLQPRGLMRTSAHLMLR